MNLSVLPKFDADAHTAKELRDLQTLADRCAEATTADEILDAGTALDAARGKHRAEARANAARNHSLNAVFKALIHEVPRRINEAGKTVAAPERKVNA